MPELPEVETVRRGLAPAMEGATIASVALNRGNLRFPFDDDFAQRLAGQRILSLSRRAKYLLCELESNDILAMHLGMSGSFRIERPHAEADRPGLFHHPKAQGRLHDHVAIHLRRPDGSTPDIVYNDPRRFGFMRILTRPQMAEDPMFRNLGVEPTGNALSPDYLALRFAGRAAPLKAALLDQTIIAGLGNIYVCEALWRARLSPRRSAGSLVRASGRPTERLERLTVHIRDTIADAIAAGGSSLRDYRQADGSLGYFQHSFAAYDREGQPCRHDGCGGTIARIVQSGRSTFFCPVCQR
ncbi:DNA-(apurinic or apyrimidinic site) lyase [Aureimonas altamirensis DSM 21988]|uniref:Formamidopyrimidine-DNA glycosylase n=1 Tax=Aureimonas altamirensis DSM 21988 TaxID=1121026 RepID=A0ABY1IP78_9HYPH|nr:bifunctional DNA-formamidopyrimidine glycosylase/DNA-(apurinic or apyrimidinic site) lyase [Aureimonas altamirensis]SHJ74639.1 DNA-(apurinic or apyrimidinic site) lyase [Aureimonas altamirensis DSM 21988]